MASNQKLTIRSSTAEFLIFETQAQTEGIEVRYEDGVLWMTQKMMAQLFSVEPSKGNLSFRRTGA